MSKLVSNWEEIMENNYLGITVGELLMGYGAGKAVPGAGTAAAQSAMKSAQLIRTVIKKTKSKENYAYLKEELDEMSKDIDSNIYPRLEYLFQADSDEFQVHMSYRNSRDKVEDLNEKKLLHSMAQESLKPCVEIPLEIAKLSMKLSEYAIFLVDFGYSTVRGDSSVALNCASAAIGGCVAIIDLNMLYFDDTSWSLTMKRESQDLMTFHEDLNERIADRQKSQKDELFWKSQGLFDFKKKYGGDYINTKLTFENIAEIVSELQNTLWKYRKAIWKHHTPKNALEVLNPKKILQILGYKFEKRLSLGQTYVKGKAVETAGVTDKTHKIVAISEKYHPHVQYFTLCHELGHIIFHANNRIYRDGPMDGAFSGFNKDIEEIQADKFAINFSMPEKLVRSEFQEVFETSKLTINEETAFGFNQGTTSVFRKKCQNLRAFSKFIATVEFYNHSRFNSLSKKLGVSQLAMAIRLEELRLVEY